MYLTITISSFVGPGSLNVNWTGITAAERIESASLECCNLLHCWCEHVLNLNFPSSHM